MSDSNHRPDSGLNGDSMESGSAVTGEEEGEYDVLYELCKDNIEFFAKDETMTGAKIHAAFLTLSLHIEIAKKRVETIQTFAHEYDYDEHTKGNGYRSFVVVVGCCIKHAIKICRVIVDGRSSLLFRKSVYFKEVSRSRIPPLSVISNPLPHSLPDRIVQPLVGQFDGVFGTPFNFTQLEQERRTVHGTGSYRGRAVVARGCH